MDETQRQSIFADNALLLASLGFAVIPLEGKSPLVGGFHKFAAPPSARTLSSWATKFPCANVGVLAGLSGVVIIDRDDANAEAAGDEIFGQSPLVVQTARGSQAYYGLKPGLAVPNANLRRFGFNIDVKSGAGYGLVPPSIHPKTGTPYRLAPGSDLAVRRQIAQLAPFNAAALHRLMQATSKTAVVAEGERANGLNNYLCRQVHVCVAFDDLLNVARSTNQSYAPPLEDSEVHRIARRVWADARTGKLKKWAGGPSQVKLGSNYMDSLLKLSKHGSDAFTLLMVLQRQHAARLRRGECIHITPKAMALSQVIPGWSRERIERARDLLLEARYLVCIREFRNKSEGALYKLADFCM